MKYTVFLYIKCIPEDEVKPVQSIVKYNPTPKAILEKNKAQLELILQSTTKPKKPKLEYVPKPVKSSNGISNLDRDVKYIPSTIVKDDVQNSAIPDSLENSNGVDSLLESNVSDILDIKDEVDELLTAREEDVNEVNLEYKEETKLPQFSPAESERNSDTEEVLPSLKTENCSVVDTIKTEESKSIKKNRDDKSRKERDDKSKSRRSDDSKSKSSSSSRHHKSSSHSRSSSSSKHKSSSSDKHRHSSSHKSSRRDSSSSKDTEKYKHRKSTDSKSSDKKSSSSSKSDKRDSSSKSHRSSSSRKTSSSSSSSKKLSSDKKSNKESQKTDACENTNTSTYDFANLSPSSIFDTDSNDEDEIMKQCRMIFDEFQNKQPESNHIVSDKNDKKPSSSSTEPTLEDLKLKEIDMFGESACKKRRVAHETNNLPVRKLPTVVPKPNHIQNAMQSIYLRQQTMLKKAEEEQKESEKQELISTTAVSPSPIRTNISSMSAASDILKPNCNIKF